MRGADTLSAIMHQLIENITLVRHGLPSGRSYGSKLRESFSELWSILVKCAQDPEAGDVVRILDALDECQKDARNQLLDKLIRFFSRREANERPFHKLKFLITSRPYEDLEEKFQSLLDIITYVRSDGDEKSEIIKQEINLVIDHHIESITRGFSNEDRKRIADRLKNMNIRTYLWLFLTVDIIAGSRSRYSRMSSIDSLLADLPLEVSDAYEKILPRSSDKPQARILLQLIVKATRQLSLQEAHIALTVASQEKSCTSQGQLDLWPQKEFKSIVRNLCGLFVSVHEGKISLVHQTAREFLTKASGSQPTRSRESQGCFDIAVAHGTMS